jgi:hypothetical protein
MADIDTGMKPQEMKSLLAKSKKEPVNCAFAQAGAPGLALLMLDRIKQPKALEQELLKRFPDAKNERRGSAFVDIEENPKLVKFTVNKAASGMARRLVKTLKGTGFNKAVVMLEDGTEVENYGEEDTVDAALAGAAGAASVPDAPPPDAPADSSVPDAPPVDASVAAQAIDASALRRDLGGLIVRIQAVTDPARKATLGALAAAANAALKANDLAATAAGIAKLREAVDGPQAAAPVKPVPGGGAVVYAKSRLAWLATRQKVQGEIEKLRGQLVTAFPGLNLEAQLDAEYTQFVAPVLSELDESLADKLDEAGNAADPAIRSPRVAEAKAIMQRYTSFLSSTPVIAALDENPFVPLAIRPTLSAALTTLAAAVR